MRTTLLLSLTFCAVSSFAQSANNRCERVRFAFYDPLIFSQPGGIERIYEADKAARLMAEKSSSDPETRRRTYEDQKRAVLEPMIKEIKDEIAKFANRQQILLFDEDELALNQTLLSIRHDLDVTKRLIPFLNLPKGSPNRLLNFEIEPTRLGVIDSKQFFDPKAGVRGFTVPPSGNIDDFCNHDNPKCEAMAKLIQKYNDMNGFGAIFDSAKYLPVEIRNLGCPNITPKIITEYEKRKK